MYGQKKNILKSNKSITISILNPIDPGIDSNYFTTTIEKNIYAELDIID